MEGVAITDREFGRIRDLLHRIAGIHLAPAKKALVSGRLARRLRHFGLQSFREYLALLERGEPPDELQTAVDLLTTNETHFFREPRHFDFLRTRAAAARRNAPFRVWSAACSSGEEPYSIAMVLADTLGDSPWEVLASDISHRVLERARTGHYPLERSRRIPAVFLKKYCLRGTGRQTGTFLVDATLRRRVRFLALNLNATLPEVGPFDVIFLRNVMIYFDADTKRRVVRRLLPCLKPGGYLLVGHSETLNGVTEELRMHSPSIYGKPLA